MGTGLQKDVLIEDLKKVFADSESSPARQFAEGVAEAIEKYIKNAIVTGTCPSGGGPLDLGTIL